MYKNKYPTDGILSRPAPEVDKPTYEIVGEVERFDMRDEALARVLLVPGTEDYKEYYSRKPELQEFDDELRRIRAAAYVKNWEKQPINSQFLPSTFYSMSVLATKDAVHGTLRSEMRHGGLETKLTLDPVEMARKIKEFAIYLGAADCRVAKLKQEWVYTRYSPELGGGPVDDMDYENIICMPVLHDPEMKKIGRGYAQETEDGWIYTYCSLVSVIIAHFIRSVGYRARALPSSNAPYFAVPAFIDAGIGEQGRHSFVVNKQYGCNWRPAAVVTDMPLAINKPVDFGLQDFCTKCKLCAEYCPSHALTFEGKGVERGVRRWCFDSDKCNKYWQQIGNSCCICQSVCPWNHTNNLMHNAIRETLQRVPSLRRTLIWADKLVYGGFKPERPPEWMVTPGYIEDNKNSDNKDIDNK
jgi:ferredoxin